NNEFMIPRGYNPPLDSEAMILLRDYLESAWLLKQAGTPRVRVLFLLNATSGCSYWRCEEPARVLAAQFSDRLYIDVTEELNYERMLAYDVIVVQRGLFGDNCTAVQVILAKLKA